MAIRGIINENDSDELVRTLYSAAPDPLGLRDSCDDLRSGYLPHALRFASYLFQGSATLNE